MTSRLRGRLVIALGLAAAIVWIYTLHPDRFAERPVRIVATANAMPAPFPPTGRTDLSGNDRETTTSENRQPVIDSVDGVNSSPSIAASNSHGGIDRSVVGQPFQISPSVIKSCKSNDVECRLVMKSVVDMVQEPRDIDWALRTEATLQASVDSEGAGKYLIRNLECRTSICVLEVEVRVPGAFPRYQGVITANLQPHGMVQGEPEHDSSGDPIVELMDFKRR